jgi:hypothetical protein
MDVTIRGKPTFRLWPEVQVVKDLSFLALSHYDGACKSAALQGGFLYGWMNQVRWFEQETERGERTEPLSVEGDFRELDMTLKICEISGISELGKPVELKGLMERLLEYSRDVRAALQRANEIDDWIIDLPPKEPTDG